MSTVEYPLPQVRGAAKVPRTPICAKLKSFFNSKANSFVQPFRRGQAWKVITAICQQVGLRSNFGTHSLRKTWGYYARMQGVNGDQKKTGAKQPMVDSLPFVPYSGFWE
jgi:integrase